MSYLQAIILGIIEGLTEFLPVSSTGHMVLASALMQISKDEFVKTFEIAIQLGAILAVVLLYYKRFLKGLNIYLKLSVAFLPAGIIGKLFYKRIKESLSNPLIVVGALVVGGILLIILDKWTNKEKSKYDDAEELSYWDALKIGLFQCLSMVPGVSRAAATIIGGTFIGFNRKQATEFSFLLAIPTMFAATGYDLYKSAGMIHSEQYALLAVGGIVAFIFAFFAVKTFLALVTRYGLKFFGWYRIIVGIIFLILSYQLGIKST